MVRIHPDPPMQKISGGVAQLGERMLCKHEVIGSIPFTSTSEAMLAGGCEKGVGKGHSQASAKVACLALVF